MATSAYEELVSECELEFSEVQTKESIVRAVLARAYRQLQTVTPQMLAEACRGQMSDGKPLWVLLADNGRNSEDLRGPVLAMLRASPLTPTVQSMIN
jgi:hypothetical protein